MEAICEIYSRMPFAFQTELPPLRGSFTKKVRDFLGSASVDTNVFLARVAPHTCEGQSYVTLVLTSADPKVHPVGHALGSASVGTKVT